MHPLSRWYGPRSCLLVGLILVGPMAAGLAAQAPETFVRTVPGNRVQLVEAGGGTVRELYHSPAWHAAHAKLEPGGRRVALLEWDRSPTTQHSALVVLQQSGRIAARLAREVQRYVWCGPGCLAYITGAYREGMDGFVPDGLYHLDLTTGITTPIPGVPYPVDLHWADFDSTLYVRTRVLKEGAGVMRYHLGTHVLTGTALKSIRLSPTGRYFLYTPAFTDSLLVLKTADNAEVSLGKLRRDATPIQWVGGERDLLLAVKREPRPAGSNDGIPRPVVGDMNPPLTYLLYDVEQGRVVRSARGRLTTWESPGRKKLLEASSGLQLLE